MCQQTVCLMCQQTVCLLGLQHAPLTASIRVCFVSASVKYMCKRLQEHTQVCKPDQGHCHCSEGGFFKGVLTFPKDYPNNPPEFRFTSEMWHPNGALLFSP